MIIPPLSGSHSTENQILAALDKTDYEQLFSALEGVSLVQGKVVYEANSPIDYVYFPGTAVFSMLATMEDGDTVEVGPVGREGLVGLRVFLVGEHKPCKWSHAVVELRAWHDVVPAGRTDRLYSA